ncbi:MAG: TRAP transporter large permease subunit, partial [Rhodobacteraceae bacterium]|nr:TRAP transporter large permease subunit [Paracoccaceae bacterium]
MLETYEIIVIGLMLGFILLIFSGYPIAWTLAGVSFWVAAIAIYGGEHFDWDTFLLDRWIKIGAISDRIWAQMQNSVLVALPNFVFMGLMLDRSGVADKLMQSFTRLFGSMQGGLAIAVCAIGILLAASTGIVGASVVLLATLSMPLMMAYGYNRALASGVVAASGTLGILIPPSIMLVIMADRLSTSVGDLFMGAVFPGLLLGVLYIVYILIFSVLRPRAAPLPADVPKVTIRVVAGVLWSSAPPALLILGVLGSIFFGIATPTEASGLGAFLATMLALGKRRLNLRVLHEVVTQTTTTTSFIFGILVGASMFALVLRGLGGDELIESTLIGLELGPHGTMFVILFIVFLLGFVLDWIQIILIILTLVAPVVKSFGFDLNWFMILFAVCL